MPTEHTTGKDLGRATFPAVAERIGEDPARFLDVNTDAETIGDTGPFALAAARIQGLETTAVVNEWLEVEAALPQGPRKEIIKRLNRQKRELKQADADAEPTGASA